MYAFARSPRWIVGHVLVVVVVVAFANLGFWQLRRLEEVRTRNALVAARVEAAPRPLTEVVGDTGGLTEDLAYRRVTVSGTYAAGDELVTAPRSYNGRPHQMVLTPLRTADGEGVLVQRGWIPFQRTWSPEEVAPPTEPVQITGVLLPPEPGGDSEPVREQVMRADPDRLEERMSLDLLPVLLLAQDQRPATGTPLLRPVELVELQEGNHLSYAVQWFLFAVVVVIGYPLLLRRRARDSADDGVPRDPPTAAEAPQRRQSRQMSSTASPTNSRRT